MTHDELGELYELYAMGVLDAEEKAEMDEHLASNCIECQSGLRRALSLSALLGTLPDPVEPPRRLRQRVLASIGHEPKSNRMWLSGLGIVSACLVVALGVLTLDNVRRRDELGAMTSELERSKAESGRLQSAFQFLNEPETRQVTFGGATPQPPRGRIFINGRQGVLLMASNLPAPPPGKTYEMWLVPKQGAPVPAGLFLSDAKGNALFLRNERVDVATIKAVAVTLEAEAGASTPTMPLVFAAGLSE